MRPLLLLLLTLIPAFAQLPVARLNTIFPPGAQIGATTEVKITGANLEEAKQLRFSHPGITATLKTNDLFTVTVATNVPASIYDVRVISKFGASNPRAFAIAHHPESTANPTNKITAPATINGKTTASAIDSIPFRAAKSERLFIECLTRRIDSKLDPVLIILDDQNHEIAHARSGGFIDFTARADADYTLKLHDIQFRGGDEFFYRLNIHKGPWIDFALPTAVARAAKSKITLYGRNLPNSKPSEFKNLEQLEIEIDAPAEPQPSYLNRRPADAAIEAFEFRLGPSNPILLTLLPQSPTIAEIHGQFFPANKTDTHNFDATKGDILTIEIISQRLGLNTDPFAVLQRVTKNDKGEEQLSDVHELYDHDQNVGGPEFNTATRDPSYRFEVKETGTYRIKIRDLFSKTISDPRRAYRLSVRKESPDFTLIAHAPAPPPQNKDLKEAAGSGLFLRRGDSIPIRILALRRDNHSEPIDIRVENLPTGVTASPLRLAPGANNGWLILSATTNAAPWIGPLEIFGGKRKARAGAIAWNVGDYNNEPVFSQLTHELLLAVTDTELAPLSITPPEKPIEAIADSKITIPLAITRRGEFNNPIKFRAYLDPLKEFEADAKATNAAFEIDLKQSKLGPGLHTFAVYAHSPGKHQGKDATATPWAAIAINVAPPPQKTP